MPDGDDECCRAHAGTTTHPRSSALAHLRSALAPQRRTSGSLQLATRSQLQQRLAQPRRQRLVLQTQRLSLWARRTSHAAPWPETPPSLPAMPASTRSRMSGAPVSYRRPAFPLVSPVYGGRAASHANTTTHPSRLAIWVGFAIQFSALLYFLKCVRAGAQRLLALRARAKSGASGCRRQLPAWTVSHLEHPPSHPFPSGHPTAAAQASRAFITM